MLFRLIIIIKSRELFHCPWNLFHNRIQDNRFQLTSICKIKFRLLDGSRIHKGLFCLFSFWIWASKIGKKTFWLFSVIIKRKLVWVFEWKVYGLNQSLRSLEFNLGYLLCGKHCWKKTAHTFRLLFASLLILWLNCKSHISDLINSEPRG